jgi:hypothetical protein
MFRGILVVGETILQRTELIGGIIYLTSYWGMQFGDTEGSSGQ